MTAPHYIAKLVNGQYVLERQNLTWRLRQPGLLCTVATLCGFGAILTTGSRRNWLAVISSAMFAAACYCKAREPVAESRNATRVPGRGPSYGPSYQNDRGRHVSEQMPQDDIDEAAMESFPASDPMASRAG